MATASDEDKIAELVRACLDRPRETIPHLTSATPAQIRQVVDIAPDHRRFFLFSNILTHNWIEGNPRAEWHGKPFEWYPVPEHYVDWRNRLMSNPLNMFLAARKHTKTTFAHCRMAYKSEYVPGNATLYWSNTEDLVIERMQEFEEIAEANPWLENVTHRGATTRKRFDNGSRILCKWVQSGAEGGHVDLMIGDDPMKELGDIPDEEIEGWYSKVILPMVNVDGEMLIMGTRKRPNDLYELLRVKHERQDFAEDLDIPAYSLTEYPAIREAWLREYPGRPDDLAPTDLYTRIEAPDLASALELDTESLHVLWPEARPIDWLKQELGGQGRAYWLREFCMIFTEAEGAIVEREWLRELSRDRKPPTGLGEPWHPSDYPEPIPRQGFDELVVGIDPAGKGRDRFAFVTVGQLSHPAGTAADEPTTIRHVLDAWQRQDVPPASFRRKLEALYDRYRPDALALEANLNQTWVADDDDIRRDVRNAIEPISTSRGKHSWEDGVPAIARDIQTGKYRFYTKGEDNHTDRLLNALAGIARRDGELVGHTPDLVMALYMCHKRLSDVSGAGSASGPISASDETESDREKRQELRDSEIGRQILQTHDRRR